MPDDVAAMQTALRVLSAYTECNPPDPADVQALRGIARHANAPLDEIACDVIKGAVRSREKASGLAHILLARVRAAAREERQAGTTPKNPQQKNRAARTQDPDGR